MTTKQLTKKITRLEKAVQTLSREMILLRSNKYDHQQQVLRVTARALRSKIKAGTVGWQRRMRQDRTS